MLVANNPPQLIRAHSAKMDRVPMRPVAMRRASSWAARTSSPISVRTRPVDSPPPVVAPAAPPVVVPPVAAFPAPPRRRTISAPAVFAHAPPPPRELGRYIKPVSAHPYDPTFHYRSGDYIDIPVADPKTGQIIFAHVPALPADAAAAGRRRVRAACPHALHGVQDVVAGAGAAAAAAREAAGRCNVMGGGRPTRRRRRKRRSFRKTKAKKNRRKRTRRRRGRRRRRRTRTRR